MSELVAPVVEFGRAWLTSARLKDTTMVEEMLNKDIEQSKSLLNHLKEVVYVEDFHIEKGPKIDKIDRLQTWGWRGKFVSPGYTAFQEHFKCQRGHMPDRIKLKFVWKLFRKYWHQRFFEREDY